jgi:hypothetical protein
VVFGSQSFTRSTTLRALSQEAETKQAKQDCDIDTNPFLEGCPSETIIAQYREKYDLTVVVRGGVYWQVVSGEYVNEQYGYRVILPDGVEGLCTPAPMPWHGFLVDVANELTPPADAEENRKAFSWAGLKSEVYVDGWYNAVFYASADDAAKATLDDYKHEYPTDLIILNHQRTTLRRLPASHYLIQFVDAKSGETMIHEEVVALREGEQGIVYSIGLRTTAARYSQDEKILKAILKGFRFTGTE